MQSRKVLEFKPTVNIKLKDELLPLACLPRDFSRKILSINKIVGNLELLPVVENLLGDEF